MKRDRRSFLTAASTLAVAGLSAEALPAAEAPKEKEQPEAGVGAAEDLMREHGVLNRILLIYEEGLRRLVSQKEVSGEVFHACASLVRKFVEDYHEKLEEKFIFPEFEKRNRLVDLVKSLRTQHEAGRKLTEVILRSSQSDRFGKGESSKELSRACRAFIRMYRPHEAREDTVLFPALHWLVTSKQLNDLGDDFSKEEDRLFGEGGFEKTVEQVAGNEKRLGLYDLSQFTPEMSK